MSNCCGLLRRIRRISAFPINSDSIPRQGTLSESQGILPNIAHDNFAITTTKIYDSEFIYACLPARKNRHQWHRTSSIYLLFMILINANDVELNPGPSNNVESNPGPSIVNSSIKLCGRCIHPVTWKSKAVCCDTCATWFHINCHNINDSTYEELGSTSVSWHCFRCKQPNYSSIVFNSQSYIDNNNLSESHSRIEYTHQYLSITSDSPTNCKQIEVAEELHAHRHAARLVCKQQQAAALERQPDRRAILCQNGTGGGRVFAGWIWRGLALLASH